MERPKNNLRCLIFYSGIEKGQKAHAALLTPCHGTTRLNVGERITEKTGAPLFETLKRIEPLLSRNRLKILSPKEAEDLLRLGTFDKGGNVLSALAFLPSVPTNILPPGVHVEPLFCSAFPLDVIIVRQAPGKRFKDELIYPVDAKQSILPGFLRRLGERFGIEKEIGRYSLEKPRNIVFNTKSHKGKEGALALFDLSSAGFELTEEGDLVFNKPDLSKLAHLPSFPTESEGTYYLDKNYLPFGDDLSKKEVGSYDHKKIVYLRGPEGIYIGTAIRGMGSHPTLGQIMPNDFILPMHGHLYGLLVVFKEENDSRRMLAYAKTESALGASQTDPGVFETLNMALARTELSLRAISSDATKEPKNPNRSEQTNAGTSVGTVRIEIEQIPGANIDNRDTARGLPASGDEEKAKLPDTDKVPASGDTIVAEAISPPTVAMSMNDIEAAYAARSK